MSGAGEAYVCGFREDYAQWTATSCLVLDVVSVLSETKKLSQKFGQSLTVLYM